MNTSFSVQLSAVKNIFPHKKNINFRGNLKKDTLEIQGTQTKAKVYTDYIDELTKEQIKNICSHPVFKDIPVRIMPDTHAGKGVPIGFTAPVGIKGEIIPSLISGDIGCGMLCCEIDTKGEDIDFEKLDEIIRTYIGNSHNKVATTKKKFQTFEQEIKSLCNDTLKVNPEKIISSLGTVGGGNHFIEIDKSKDNHTYLVIHTGSRGFGQAVFNYHQDIALKQNPYEIENLSYLTGDEAKEYLKDMKIAQKYAQINRRIIADEIIKGMNWDEKASFESVHNYIADDNIIRKGAISALDGQKIIIPLNMRDGALIAIGKGNKDWNNSAPHGSGRKLSRSEAHNNIKLEEYKKAMDGIYTTCVCNSTLDESPMAYKNSDDIKQFVEPTAEIVENIKPQYNFKNKG